MSFKYDVIIFDFDGVLAESVEVKTRAFATLYKQHGPAVVAKVVAHHLSHGGLSRYKKIAYYHEAFLKEPINDAAVNELAEQFSNLVVQGVVESLWVPGAKEFLDEYAPRLPCYIASGTPTNELRGIVNKRGMSKYFKGVYGSPSRKADIINSILLDVNAAPDRALMIGDAVEDLNAAIESGTQFIGRKTQNFQANGDYVFLEDLRSLGDFLICKECA